jgi:hypothetical protein
VIALDEVSDVASEVDDGVPTCGVGGIRRSSPRLCCRYSFHPTCHIQLGTGTAQRLYKVLTDANSDSSGNATFDIFPTLREGVSDSQPITTSNCMGTFRLAANQSVRSADYARIYGIDFKAEEAF